MSCLSVLCCCGFVANQRFLLVSSRLVLLLTLCASVTFAFFWSVAGRGGSDLDPVEAHISTLSVGSVLIPPPCLQFHSHLRRPAHSTDLSASLFHSSSRRRPAASRRLAQSHTFPSRPPPPPTPLFGTSAAARCEPDSRLTTSVGGMERGAARGAATRGGEEEVWRSTSTSPAAGLSVVHLSGGEGETQADQSARRTGGRKEERGGKVHYATRSAAVAPP